MLYSSNFAIKKQFSSREDVFGTRVFIENKGQFSLRPFSEEDIKYVYDSGSEHVYFTNKGLVYKFIKKYPLTEKIREDLEKGKKVHRKQDQVYYVKMNWLNANDSIQIIESEKQNYYFTYGGPEYNSYGYKKITYKNVYNNIDIEYTFNSESSHGIKYNIILHPGANPSDIKIVYTGDVNKIIEKKGEIIIKTPVEDITEHAPISYYEDKQQVQSYLTLGNKIISYSFLDGCQHNKTLIIDPWVTTLSQLLTTNYGYDVDYDYNGNLFVYGGIAQTKVAKYDPNGNLLWVFSGSIPAIPWDSDGDLYASVGNFIVNKKNNKTYVGQGAMATGGTRVIRLNQAGNYDNFITTAVANWRELWDMGFHCGSGKVFGLGGGTSGNTSGSLIDEVTGVVSPSNFTGVPNTNQDIVSNAIDDNGNIFVYFSNSISQSMNNTILRINQAFNGNFWIVPSTYTNFNELGNKASYVGLNINVSNGFNCLGVNNNYLFMYDGFNLAAYDKNTGAKIGFTTVAGLTPLEQGGIAADDCDNVYVGGNGNILCYHFNGSVFTAVINIPLGVATPNKYVYDIKLDRNTHTLFVSGSGFVGTYNASASSVCGGISLVTSCTGNNNG